MNKLLMGAAILGIISVVMGAAGDHAFKFNENQLDSLQTAIRYNMLYAVLVCVLSLQEYRNIRMAGWIFLIGTGLFSFSIYASLLLAVPALTYLTPVGGVTLMTGWAYLVFCGIRKK